MNVTQAYDPRANQKQRTRTALVDAALRLLRAGKRPTVAEAAEEAKVSRATAYRYFPTQESLLVEAAFTPAIASVDQLFEGETSADPEERLLKLLDRFNPIVLAEEGSMRTALRAYLDAWFQNRQQGDDSAQVREGRRVRWLEAALEPVLPQLTEAEQARLRSALALTLGIEPVLVMKDVCRIDDDEALSVLRWTAQALLRQALADSRSVKERRSAGVGSAPR